MQNNTLHKLGIDIGSTTVKIAILDHDNTILFSDYERHYANIQETLASLLQKAFSKLGELGTVLGAFFRLQGMIWLSLPLVALEAVTSAEL